MKELFKGIEAGHKPGVIEERLEEFKYKEKTEPGFPKGRLDWYDDKFIVAGRTIENIGVYHHVSALMEYGKQLQDAVRRASVVVLEGAPTAGGMFSEAYVEKQIELAKNKGNPLPREYIKANLHQGGMPGVYFFKIIEEICAREGKPIVVVDPGFSDFNELGDEERFQAMRKETGMTDADWALVKREAGIVGGSFAVILGVELLSRILPEKPADTKPDENRFGSEEGITRRNLLKRGVQGAAALVIGQRAIAKFFRAQEAIHKSSTPFGDFRDVISAKGLEMLAKKNLGDGPILLIYGTPHSKGIQEYSSRPEEMVKQYDAYKKLRDIRRPALRIYRFEENEWRTKEKQET